jgi:hypothetical protein
MMPKAWVNGAIVAIGLGVFIAVHDIQLLFGLMLIGMSIYALHRSLSLLTLHAPVLTLLALIVASFVPFGFWFLTFGSLLLVVVFRPWRFFIQDMRGLFGTDIIPLVLWIFLVLFLSLQSLWLPTGFFAEDPLHPLYELSIGRSYEIPEASPADLSYAGKDIRFHFLTTRLPLLFEAVPGIDLLQSTFVVVPLVLLSLLGSALRTLFDEFGSKLLVPVALIVPVIGFLKFGSLLTFSVALTPSYAAGAILVASALLLLLQRSHGLFLLVIPVLTLVKAPFGLVLAGTLPLYFSRKFAIRAAVKYGVLSAILFLLPYLFFVNGSHEHNLWIFFPASLQVLFGRVVSEPLFALGVAYFALILVPSIIYFIKDRDRSRSILSSFVLAGLVGFVLLVELTEGNDKQFLVPVILPVVLLAWDYVRAQWSTGSRVVFSMLLVFSVSVLGALSYTSLVSHVVDEHVVGMARVECSVCERFAREPFDQEVVRAYEFAESLDEGVFVYGRHYELIPYVGINNPGFTPSAFFLRSALSGQQMYVENSKYKSVGMQDDFPLRVAESIFLYRTYVNLSNESKQRLVFLENRIMNSSEPSEATFNYPRVLYAFNKFSADSWITREEEVDWHTQQYLQSYSTDRWLENWLESSGVRYMVLELGDEPGPELGERAIVVYSGEDVQILEIQS